MSTVSADPGEKIQTNSCGYCKTNLYQLVSSGEKFVLEVGKILEKIEALES